ncbi:agmatinase [Bacteroidota bacterium]
MNNSISILGIPFDEYSSSLKGAADGPEKIREALYSDSTNLCTENIIDLSNKDYLKDIGDLQITDFLNIEKQVSEILSTKTRLISIGGDHSITYPIVKAFNKHYKNLNILHFDAHPDLYEEYQGNPYSHACPFARIMGEKLTSELFQVGIRTMNTHQKKQSEKYNTKVFDMKSWQTGTIFNFTGPVYISLDLDVLDPAFAPGLSHPEPGGFSTRELISIIQNLNCDIVGADIVELNPKCDTNNLTARVAAKLLKEIAELMLDS